MTQTLKMFFFTMHNLPMTTDKFAGLKTYWLRFRIKMNTKQVISETFPKPISWLGMERQNLTQLECGPMPNLMVALPNTGGALCSTPQSLAHAHY